MGKPHSGHSLVPFSTIVEHSGHCAFAFSIARGKPHSGHLLTVFSINAPHSGQDINVFNEIDVDTPQCMQFFDLSEICAPQLEQLISAILLIVYIIGNLGFSSLKKN